MVRRRSPSPSPPKSFPTRANSSLPARPPPSMPAHVPPPQPRQPGLMGQMAATAGGVAIGSVVGNAITGAISGRGGETNSSTQNVTSQNSEYQQRPCQFQIDELVRCTQTQNDISLCTGFADALKECSRNYGVYYGQQ